MKKISYQLDKFNNKPLYIQLYEQIKKAIHGQEIKIGDKLPSKRHLCDVLQISRNTVESAYSQLLSEGYIESFTRKGFYVCFEAELLLQQDKAPYFLPDHLDSKADEECVTEENEFAYNFASNQIDASYFPFEIWKKCGREVTGQAQSNWLALGDFQGEKELRQQIVEYLNAARGISCNINQIIIAAGQETCFQYLILLFNHIFPKKRLVYGMEPYGYTVIEKLLRAYDKTIYQFKISANEKQMDLSDFLSSQVDIAYITPSRQNPFGQALTIGQRQQILEWAGAATTRYIIEDDYEGEFRYKGKPVPALKGLDQKNTVIYLGSFSKLLMPSLRISFMVLPVPLVPLFKQHCGFFNTSVSRLEQQRLALFMRQGEFEKHINRMRKIYRKKMELCCNILSHYADKVGYYGEYSGFYLLIEIFNESRTSKQLVELAEKNKIKVYPMELEDKKMFSIGFGHLNEQQITRSINMLMSIWKIDKKL